MRIGEIVLIGVLSLGWCEVVVAADSTPQDKLGAALLSAAEKGNIDQATALINQGAPLEARDFYNRTPLLLACFGHPEMVRLLLSYGGKVDAVAKNGDTTIGVACEYGQLATVQLLLDAGADVNRTNEYGRTPLMLAAREGHDDVVSLLISHHVDLDFHDPDAPALFFAISHDHVSTAKLLLDAGADPRVGWSKKQDPNELVTRPLGWLGWTRAGDPNEALFHLMMWATATNDPAMVDLVLEHGLNVNSCSQKGMTVLIKAVQSDKPAIIEHLLDKGADPNLQQDDGQTALMLSVNYQQPAILQALLDHGAKLETRDKQGRTALMWACAWVYDPNIVFLIDHGADINATDLNGETPLTYAGNRGDTEMVKFLQDKGATRTDVHVIAQPKPQPPLSPARLWALAVGAIYVQINGSNPSVLGYDNPETVEEVQRNLKQDWGITDRASFLARINEFEESGHRAGYQQDGILLAGLSDLAFNEKLLLLSPEKQVEARNLRSSYLKWKEKSGLAWDLCRVGNLINFGVDAHYINEQEAWPLLMQNARLAQAGFSSWQEMSDNYQDGREIWATGIQLKYAACAQLLCNPKDPNSPWNQIPWKTDLTGN